MLFEQVSSITVTNTAPAIWKSSLRLTVGFLYWQHTVPYTFILLNRIVFEFSNEIYF